MPPMKRNGDVRCGDCEHFADEGCEQAAEALALDGWPRAEVAVAFEADAARCPEFRPGEGLALALDDEREERCRRLAAAVRKGFLY